MSPFVLLIVGYGKTKKNALQISNYPLVLHQKALVLTVRRYSIFSKTVDVRVAKYLIYKWTNL